MEAAAQANAKGLEAFAAGQLEASEQWLRKAYRLWPEERGSLVNLGLALMQQRRVAEAERCYRLAVLSSDLRVKRSASKNLGFLKLWCGEFEEGWHWHGQRFQGEAFLRNQWKGETLNGKPLVVWNDVGMGDAFHFVRYTLPLVERGERIIFAVDANQIEIFQQHLGWPLEAVIDRRKVDRVNGVHIPLMSLIPVLDIDTSWGRQFSKPTWKLAEQSQPATGLGLCWASNPGDRSMHCYKSTSPEVLLRGVAAKTLISLQSNEQESHKRLGLAAASSNWIDTLERISRCKRVHSVDTAVAHLAAGAGIEVALWLGGCHDWRWSRITNNKPWWYPNIIPLKNELSMLE